METPVTLPYYIVDLETQSLCDLEDCGGFVYAEHPTTRLLTASWFDGEQYHLWIPSHVLPEHHARLHLPDVTLHSSATPPIPRDRPWVGHNAWSFDEPVWAALYPDHLPTEWRDSQCEAMGAGLPGSLNQIGVRLWGEGKYLEGAASLDKAFKGHNKPVGNGDLALIGKYCVQDVKLTAQLMEELAVSYRPPPFERRLQQTHRRINIKGIRIDAGLVTALQGLAGQAVDFAVSEIARLTNGKFKTIKDLGKRTEVLKWVKDAGHDLGDSLRRDIVDKWVNSKGDQFEEPEDEVIFDPEEEGTTPAASLRLVTRVLKLRQTTTRTTKAKLEAAGLAMNRDERARGLYRYHGAGPGRFSAQRLNPLNMPKPKVGVPYWQLVELYESKGALDIDNVLLLLDEEFQRLRADGVAIDAPATPDDAASALMRGLFIPDEGQVWLDADLSTIEVRKLAWLAGEEWLLEAFRKGSDVYLDFAEKVTGIRYDKKSKERDLWKACELGLGYRLGANQLHIYLASQPKPLYLSDYGLTAAGVVDAYRDTHQKIAGYVQGTYNGHKWRRGGLWYDVENAALAAIGTGIPQRLNWLEFYMERGHLYIKLPSGREIVYRNARVEMLDFYGKPKPTMTFDSARFKRTKTHGGKLVENIDQGSSRDVLAEIILRAEADGLLPTLHVYDQAAVSARPDDLDRFGQLMTVVPDWAPGLPVDAEGAWLPRWAKSPKPPQKDTVWKSKRN